MNKPRYEKVDDHTVRVITEKAKEMDLTTLLRNKKSITEQRDNLNDTLGYIEEIIKEAKKLGITEEEKDVNPQKSKK